MTKPIDHILAPRPVLRPRIYAYSIDDAAHAGLLKIGQTTCDVKQGIFNYSLQNLNYSLQNLNHSCYTNCNNTCQASQRCSNRRVFLF